MPSPGIFFYEAWAVVSALDWVVQFNVLQSNLRIAIYTDNMNTVDMRA